MLKTEDKNKIIRFATIGTGFITKMFLEAASKCNQFELVAVYSRNLEKGRAFINNKENIRVYDSLEELASSKDIDAVYISSPTYCHAHQSILMLNNGKHVFCEKPIASNSLEWNNMLKASYKNNSIILEAMRPIFTPGYQIIKENLKKLGKIRNVNFSYCQYSSRYDNFKNGIIENAFKPELSNGALMDIGVYCVAMLVGIFGEPNRICAHGYIIPNSIDGMGSITASYEEMEANLIYSKISNSLLPCEIQGEVGNMYFDNIGAPQNIYIKYRDGSEEKLNEEADPFSMIYEIETFIDILFKKRLVDEYNNISTITIKVLDEARRQIGIVFPADLHL